MKLSENSENFSILEQVAEQSLHAFFIYDLVDKHLHYVNPAFEEIWQRSRESVYKDLSAILDTVHPEDKSYLVDKFQNLLENQEVKSVEFRIVLPDHSVRWVCITGYLIYKKDNVRFISGYVEDISKNKAYSQNILKFNAKKNSVLEILSHDLASPLHTIQGMTNVLEKKLAQHIDPSVKELLGFIKDSCIKGTNLIRDFVNHEFLESSQVVLNKKRIDLVQKIAEIIESYKKGQVLIPKQFEVIAASQSVFVEIDEMKFIQAINNLISNAIKFTHDNGKIAVQIQEEEKNILITVEDNGIGIPEDMQPYLFDKFTKARRPGIKGEKSTGLGMSIIKTIIELHEGTIWFESQENKGTTFYVSIPRNG
jgi:two-component system sensor histidine kinase VicK